MLASGHLNPAGHRWQSSILAAFWVSLQYQHQSYLNRLLIKLPCVWQIHFICFRKFLFILTPKFNTSLDTQKSCILEIWPVSSYWTLVGNICGIGTVHSDRTWVQLIGGQVTDGTHVSSGAGQAPVTGVSPLPVVVGQDWAGVGVPGITSQTVGASVAGDGGGTPGT